MKKLSILFLLLLPTLTKGQVKFNKYINNQGFYKAADQALDIEQLKDNSYLVPSISIAIFTEDTLGFAKTATVIYKLNTNGDTVLEKSYSKEKFQEKIRQIEYINNNNFLLAGNVFDLVKYHQDTIGSFILLIKINQNGDTLWRRTLNIGDGDEFVSNLIKTKDGGFAILGQVCDKLETNCDAYLMKLDSNANLLWYRIYTWDIDSWELPQKVLETKNGEFVFTIASNKIRTEVYSPHIVKTNSNGAILWQKIVPNSQFYGYFEDVIETNSGNYLFGGVIGDNRLPNDSYKAWLLKTDTSGNILYEKMIGDDNKFTFINKLFEIDNNVIIQGQTDNYNIPNSNSPSCILLYRLDTLGNTIWRRVYKDSLVTNGVYIVYNTIQTNDKGFAMVGFGRNPKDTLNTQDVWVLKVDSLGCLYDNNCLSLGIDEVLNTDQLIIYPNPAQNELNIINKEINNDSSSYEIYSLDGRRIQTGFIINNKINISSLNSGLYLLKTESGVGRFVVE